MTSVIKFIESLDRVEQQQLMNSPTLRELFAEEIAEELEFSKQEVLLELEKRIAQSKDDIDEVMQIRNRLISFGNADSFNIRRKKAVVLDDVIEVLEVAEKGLAKTEILRQLKKDNGTWRHITQEVLNYLLMKGTIVKVGCRYYLSEGLLKREASFHKRVYDVISENVTVSKSFILNRLRYRNPSGNSKLNEALSLMKEEGFIEEPIEGRWKAVTN